ncbi:MAG: DUF2905 domain-containing protein [Firmicutes bacterium]|nr:DUF2905 domain-containing protein [Bacillota bacterium]
MNLEQLGKFLIMFAAIIAVTGIVIFLIGKGFGIGRLPGDILLRRNGWSVFIPIATSILLSVILTILLNVIIWLFRR